MWGGSTSVMRIIAHAEGMGLCLWGHVFQKVISDKPSAMESHFSQA